jgi:L,D-transpeptidase catalytic domain
MLLRRLLFSSVLLTLIGALKAGDHELVSNTIPLSESTKLPPGKFEWEPHRSEQGALSMTVDLSLQMLEVFRGGVLIARSSVCTGRKGHRTPCGAYNILGKEEIHYSNLYDNAPMPFMMRLTCDGVALHGGYIADNPASHGCVRLPREFARRLFQTAQRGDAVTIIWDKQSKTPPDTSGLGKNSSPLPSASPAKPNSPMESASRVLKSLAELEDEELKIRSDPSISSSERMQKLKEVWSQQVLMTKPKRESVSPQ